MNQNEQGVLERAKYLSKKMQRLNSNLQKLKVEKLMHGKAVK